MFTPSTFFDGIDTNIPTASGGNIHEVFGYVVHEFTASGTFIPAKTARYEFFMVGRGGNGQDAASTPSSYGGGGGGGGEVILGAITLISASSYDIDFDENSIPSELSFAGIIAYQGGDGGDGNSSTTAYNGQDGYSGGSGKGGSGGGGAISTGGSLRGVGGDSNAAKGFVNYLYRFGYNGGNATIAGNGAAGGGGAGGNGSNGGSSGGAGGQGYPNNWLGSTLYYGGGGGGYPSGTGNGGGGNASTTTNGSAGNPRDNSGGGGGGENNATSSNKEGALGIVLIRYRTSV